jgi:hypothetical protein
VLEATHHEVVNAPELHGAHMFHRHRVDDVGFGSASRSEARPAC